MGIFSKIHIVTYTSMSNLIVGLLSERVNGFCEMLKNLFNIQNHPFNRAAKLFGQLRYLDESSQEYWQTIMKIIKLCWEAIKTNKYDGDSHVLLANIYLLTALGAFQESKLEGYAHNVACCAAVIYEWKTNPRMYSKEKLQGEKIYQNIISRPEEPKLNWMNTNLPSNISILHKDYYLKAIGTDQT